jgi:carbon-monoxide dehydrogenase small subunit
MSNPRYKVPTTLQAAVAMLAGATNPTKTEVRYRPAGDPCRCTGYDKIVQSVLAAAAEMGSA